MVDLESDNGMALLAVDGEDVGVVYYEIVDGRLGSSEAVSGILTGDPFDLKRAIEEKNASLLFIDNREVPVEVTRLLKEHGTAVFMMTPNAAKKF